MVVQLVLLTVVVILVVATLVVATLVVAILVVVHQIYLLMKSTMTTPVLTRVNQLKSQGHQELI